MKRDKYCLCLFFDLRRNCWGGGGEASSKGHPFVSRYTSVRGWNQGWDPCWFFRDSVDVNSREIVSRENSRAMEQCEISRKNSLCEFTTSQISFHVNSRLWEPHSTWIHNFVTIPPLHFVVNIDRDFIIPRTHWVRLNWHSRIGLLENILIIFCEILKVFN